MSECECTTRVDEVSDEDTDPMKFDTSGKLKETVLDTLLSKHVGEKDESGLQGKGVICKRYGISFVACMFTFW